MLTWSLNRGLNILDCLLETFPTVLWKIPTEAIQKSQVPALISTLSALVLYSLNSTTAVRLVRLVSTGFHWLYYKLPKFRFYCLENTANSAHRISQHTHLLFPYNSYYSLKCTCQNQQVQDHNQLYIDGNPIHNEPKVPSWLPSTEPMQKWIQSYKMRSLHHIWWFFNSITFFNLYIFIIQVFTTNIVALLIARRSPDASPN